MPALTLGLVVNSTEAIDSSYSATDVSYFEFILDRETLGNKFVIKIPRSAATILRAGYYLEMYTYGIPMIKGIDDYIIYYDLTNYPTCSRISLDGYFTTDNFDLVVAENPMILPDQVIYYDTSIVKDRFIAPTANAPIITPYESENECVVLNPTDRDLYITSIGYDSGYSYVTSIPPGQYFVSLCDPAILDSDLQYIILGESGAVNPGDSLYTKDIVIPEDAMSGSGIFDYSSGSCNGKIMLPAQGMYRISFKVSEYTRIAIYDENHDIRLGYRRCYGDDVTSIVVSCTNRSMYYYELSSNGEWNNPPRATFFYERIGDDFTDIKSLCSRHTFFADMTGKLRNTTYTFNGEGNVNLYNSTLSESFSAESSVTPIALPETWLNGHMVRVQADFWEYPTQAVFTITDAVDYIRVPHNTSLYLPSSDSELKVFISHSQVEFEPKIYISIEGQIRYYHNTYQLIAPIGAKLLSVNDIELFIDNATLFEFIDNSTSSVSEVGEFPLGSSGEMPS